MSAGATEPAPALGSGARPSSIDYSDAPASRSASCARRWIIREVENSLKRLGTDWIGLYQIHRYETDVEIEETLAALTDLVHQGKVRYIGSGGGDGRASGRGSLDRVEKRYSQSRISTRFAACLGQRGCGSDHHRESYARGPGRPVASLLAISSSCTSARTRRSQPVFSSIRLMPAPTATQL